MYFASMGSVSTGVQFFNHLFRSKRWSAFHSPFLFDLFTYCCDERNGSTTFKQIEKQRKALIASEEMISRKDFGAGSVLLDNAATGSISAIAKNALSMPFQCRFLFRLAAFMKPGHILEFGTSLGISTSYLSSGAPYALIHTVEGDPEIAKRAAIVFNELGLKNIELHTTSFDQYIFKTASGKETPDLLFLDGHHTAYALLSYFTSLKERLHPNTIIVVDDIHWSKDMNSGWKKLIALPEVTQSVNCFHFGLLFFRPDFLNRENHEIYLPLRMMVK